MANDTAMTREEQLDNIKSYLGEGFHTAFRRPTNSHQAMVVWEAIQECPGEDWDAVLEFVAGPLLDAWPRLTGQVDRASGTELARAHPESAARVVIASFEGRGDFRNAWDVLESAFGHDKAKQYLQAACAQRENSDLFDRIQGRLESS